MRPGNVTIYANIICNVCKKRNKKQAILVEKRISCLKGILRFLKSSAEGEIKKNTLTCLFWLPLNAKRNNFKDCFICRRVSDDKKNSLKNFSHFYTEGKILVRTLLNFKYVTISRTISLRWLDKQCFPGVSEFPGNQVFSTPHKRRMINDMASTRNVTKHVKIRKWTCKLPFDPWSYLNCLYTTKPNYTVHASLQETIIKFAILIMNSRNF